VRHTCAEIPTPYGSVPGRRPPPPAGHRLFLTSLGTVLVALLVASSAFASSFSGSLISSASTFSSGTLQLGTTVGSSNCYSTGTGSGGTVSSNSNTCSAGSPVASTLSASSSSSVSTTVTSNGRNNPTTGYLGSTSCGVAAVADTATATDWSGTGPDTGLVFKGVTFGQAGPLGTTALGFDGSTGYVETTTQYTNPETFTILAWIKTTVAHGAFIGFDNIQNAPVNGGSEEDRLLWIDPSGRLDWAVYPGSNQIVTSVTTVTSGSWDFVAATIGQAGQVLYINGAKVGSGTATTSESYSGFWDLGYSLVNSGWGGDVPASDYFDGSLAQVAIIPSQLSNAQISTLYGDNTLSSYSAAVEAYNPANYWQLNDTGMVPYDGSVPYGTASTSLTDASGNANNATAQGGTTLGTTGPISGLGASAVGITLNGSTGYGETTTEYSDPNTFSLVGWFKSTSSTGGVLIEQTSNQATATPASYDRSLWLDNTGHLVWGTDATGTPSEITSSSAYNTGSWNMFVAELGPTGKQLWVNGTEVGSAPSVTTASNIAGWWHLGWGYLASPWTDRPTDSYLTGNLSEMAFLPSQLTSTQISALYGAGSVAGFGQDMGAFLTSTSDAYWPMQNSASNICGTSEITVQQTVSATNTCIYPPSAGSCPAPSAAYLVTSVGIRSFTPPTSARTVTITVTMEESSATIATLAGLHELLGFGFGTALGAGSLPSIWTAQVAYPSAVSQI
jgi:Concanavalin A-like lectin/glucanases superfamily